MTDGTGNHNPSRVYFIAALFVTILILALPTLVLSWPSGRVTRGITSRKPDRQTHESKTNQKTRAVLVGTSANASLPLLNYLLVQGPIGETISTYEADCVTPSDSFDLGDTVCVKITGAPLGSGGIPVRRLNWVSRAGSVSQSDSVVTSDQTFSFTLPATETSTIESTVFSEDGTPSNVLLTYDNRGTWKVSSNSLSDGAVRTSITFSVHSPTLYSDLSVLQDTGSGSQVNAGSSGVFNIKASNNGPDAAQNVELVETVPANTTFISLTETSGGSLFTCGAPSDGQITCTAASMPANSTVSLSFVYEVNAGTAADTIITNNVSIASTTTELDDVDNTSSAFAVVPGESGVEACTIDCRQSFTVTADTTQSGVHGAIVNFTPTDSIIGNCGAILTTPSTGTFFPVGATVVAVTSETGGGSCSFTITVVDTAPPTISCPANQTVTAAAGESSATVNPGTPSATSAGTHTVSGERSDSLPLTDPYPIGITTITWTVTDDTGRTASCTQRITVIDNACGGDTTAPTITAPPDVTVGTGPDNPGCTIGLDSELGEAVAEDECSVNVTISGIPAGNAFPKGTTTLTYTATDGSGNTASDTQLVTVIDDTAPVIVAPANASYTCPSEVPAGSPSQARGADVNLPDGGPPTDNCGPVVVTVSDSSNGGAGSSASPLVITRTYTATDSAGNSSSSAQTITVIDSTAPTITLNGANPQVVECHTSYTELGATAADNCSGNFAATPTSNVNTNVVGTYTVTYTASDAAGNAAVPVIRTVNVVDTTAPTITLNGQTPSMWPPNHKYKTFQVTEFVTSVSDSCDTPLGLSSVVIEKVTSDEVENGNGDGNTSNDIIIAANCKSVQLRSEREGGGNGRVYTITFRTRDASGNTARATAKVVVPHNSGGTAVDSGVHYTVTSACP